MSIPPIPAPDPAQKKWAQKLGTFATPTLSRSLTELGLTVGGLLLCWGAMLWTISFSYPLTLLISLLAGGFIIRIFIIQHDCGHGSYFRKASRNRLLGRILGVITMVPYDCWRGAHAHHHAGHGNLDRRGTGDVDTLTLKEYKAKSKLQKFGYWVYRHPIILLGFGPIWYFMIKMRIPFIHGVPTKKVWSSVMWTNVGMMALFGSLAYWLGLKNFFLLHFPMYFVAHVTGVWMFYIQHQFEDTHWEDDADWEHQEAALEGSSYYQLPRPLEWLTGNIGIHHVHHLNSRIPFYRLPDCIEHFETLEGTNRVNTRQALKATFLALWDQEDRRLVSFAEARRLVKERETNTLTPPTLKKAA